jgi:hypothetical protein
LRGEREGEVSTFLPIMPMQAIEGIAAIVAVGEDFVCC